METESVAAAAIRKTKDPGAVVKADFILVGQRKIVIKRAKKEHTGIKKAFSGRKADLLVRP